VKTVQQKYMKDKNEEEIGSTARKERRKAQAYEVSLLFQQLQNLQNDGWERFGRRGFRLRCGTFLQGQPVLLLLFPFLSFEAITEICRFLGK